MEYAALVIYLAVGAGTASVSMSECWEVTWKDRVEATVAFFFWPLWFLTGIWR